MCLNSGRVTDTVSTLRPARHPREHELCVLSLPTFGPALLCYRAVEPTLSTQRLKDLEIHIFLPGFLCLTNDSGVGGASAWTTDMGRTYPVSRAPLWDWPKMPSPVPALWWMGFAWHHTPMWAFPSSLCVSPSFLFPIFSLLIQKFSHLRELNTLQGVSYSPWYLARAVGQESSWTHPCATNAAKGNQHNCLCPWMHDFGCFSWDMNGLLLLYLSGDKVFKDCLRKEYKSWLV